MNKLFILSPFEENSMLKKMDKKFSAQIKKTAPTRLDIEFILEGDLSQSQIKEPSSGAIVWGSDLWKETCFELFLAFPGTREYWEWNVSPTGQVCSYKLSDYREHEPVDALMKDSMAGVMTKSFLKSPTRLSISFEINLSSDPKLEWNFLIHKECEVNLSAILLDATGRSTYWAPKHATSKADFHQRSQWSRVAI